jgi:hypothetical protein
MGLPENRDMVMVGVSVCGGDVCDVRVAKHKRVQVLSESKCLESRVREGEKRTATRTTFGGSEGRRTRPPGGRARHCSSRGLCQTIHIYAHMIYSHPLTLDHKHTHSPDSIAALRAVFLVCAARCCCSSDFRKMYSRRSRACRRNMVNCLAANPLDHVQPQIQSN